MKVGIVGHEAKKFTPRTEKAARLLIRELLRGATAVVSGHCHLGGIDIWAEEEATRIGGIEPIIFPPKSQTWTHYKARNIQIANAADVVHNIVVEDYPEGYDGMRFDFCYHCKASDHIKSGGCWTAKYASCHGKEAMWHICTARGWRWRRCASPVSPPDPKGV